MKNVLYFIFLITGCTLLFEKKETLLAEYRLQNGQTIRAYLIGTGATTKDRVQLRRTDFNQEIILKEVQGYANNDKTEIIKINDTLFKIRFTDTLYFKGSIKEEVFTLNERIEKKSN